MNKNASLTAFFVFDRGINVSVIHGARLIRSVLQD